MPKSTAISVGKGVQFNGPEQVLAAYESRDLPAFSLWCGKQFMYAYEEEDIQEGKQMLAGWLENLKQSAATYTVAVYRKFDPDEGITAQTPYHGSFNFRMQEKPLTYLGEAYGSAGGNWKHLADELQRLKEENETLRDENAELEEELKKLEAEKEAGVGGKIGGMLGGMATELMSNPAIVDTIATGIAGWLQKIMTPAQTGSPKALAGGDALQWQARVEPPAAAVVHDSLNKLFAAPGIDVPALLQMLATMAVEDPQKFATYVDMFKAMAK